MFSVDVRIFHRILSMPQNIVMDLNNVMTCASCHVKFLNWTHKISTNVTQTTKSQLDIKGVWSHAFL